MFEDLGGKYEVKSAGRRGDTAIWGDDKIDTIARSSVRALVNGIRKEGTVRSATAPEVENFQRFI